MNHIQHAQNRVDEFHSLILDLIPQYVNVYADFFQQHVDKFKMFVVEDGIDLDHEEFSVSNQVSIVLQAYEEPLDYLSAYIHLMSHRLLNHQDYFWHKNKIPRNHFDEQMLALIEDIYIQRLLRAVNSPMADHFYSVFRKYQIGQSYTDPIVRESLNTLLTQTVDESVPIEIRAVHSFLENSDPFAQETFNLYVRYWYGLLQNPDLYALVEKYD